MAPWLKMASSSSAARGRDTGKVDLVALETTNSRLRGAEDQRLRVSLSSGSAHLRNSPRPRISPT